MQERDLVSKPISYALDLRCLAILVVLVVGVRGWQLSHTEVASRDSISYVRIAWQLEHAPWRQVMPASPQHPGYPLAVLAMSLPVRQFFPDDLPRAWQLSTQLVSALASVLLLVPMFYLGKELFDRRIAFWACLLFQCLPTSGKVMGDGLSDTLFLLFACSSLWLATVALRRRSSWPFALTGLAGGLAYWVRPEGALLVAATGLVLLGMQWSKSWRQEWRKVLIQGSVLALTAIAVVSPYMLIIGGLTVKNTALLLINQQRPDADWEKRLRPKPAQNAEPHADASQPGSLLFAAWFGPGDRTFDKLAKEITDVSQLQNYRMPSRHLWALNAFILEAGKGFFYVVWMPMLFGLWWFRERFRVVPGLWVGLLVCLALLVLLFRMAEKMGYLSDRHLLFVILCGTYWAVAGTFVIGEKLATGAARLWPKLAGRCWMDGWIWSLALLILMVSVPLPRTLARLHSERAGFRSLGHWLAEHTRPGDFIDDPYCWAYYYAGRVFVEGCRGLPVTKPSCFYVVLEESKNRHARVEFLLEIVKCNLHTRRAEMVHAEEVRRGRDKATLQVWRVPGPYRSAPMPPLPAQRSEMPAQGFGG
jgi:4-amino-4-deoxy-L-arabinose transferase-like glycosyltransferase